MPQAIPQTISHATITTPIGSIHIGAGDTTVTYVRIGGSGWDAAGENNALLREAVKQLTAWFDGRLTAFDLPLDPLTTPRGEAHRAAIRDIPHGETASYGALARQLGSSPRAIGQACRRNPVPIVIPCHRVVGAGGTIGHFSAGEGVKTKLWLLQHEGRTA